MLDPELKPFLEIWDTSWSVLPQSATPHDRRILFEAIADAMRLPPPDDVRTATRFVPRKKRNVLVRIDRHESGGVQPCLIYMHGGGWMQGSPKTHADITSRIASKCRQTVISVDYALAPEHPFPTALDEVQDTIRWAHANARVLGIDPGRIAVGGDSAGANLAAAACIALRGTEFAPTAQLLIYPAVSFEMDKPSIVENAEGPLLKTAGMKSTNLIYCGSEENLRNPLAAPLMAESHAGLPAAFVAVAEYDPLRDDGYAYANALRAAGVPVEVDDGKGLIHGYLRAMEYCAASRKGLERMCGWLAQQNEQAAERRSA